MGFLTASILAHNYRVVNFYRGSAPPYAATSACCCCVAGHHWAVGWVMWHPQDTCTPRTPLCCCWRLLLRGAGLSPGLWLEALACLYSLAAFNPPAPPYASAGAGNFASPGFTTSAGKTRRPPSQARRDALHHRQDATPSIIRPRARQSPRTPLCFGRRWQLRHPWPHDFRRQDATSLLKQ